ncbi:oligosaccharide repeat unit polymerase [Paenibacillus cellulosilyticus]|uniref:Oligosaccharide repeat unit polymerase n=1 Tax=Paenibacillus cellulosilyticus TaxID=375489 RepID=A0A2V2YLV7_9BACL|nr:O-antigen polymerase [Paenibacillus cellulosilyticus]PWV93815.1 oligosaccharide repeat unit polymerase [Paenibacillus cellulosilyticus]QKS47430.1 oligosaccharide repeat unit polymerase [Paenibacillus cellulosilyticus]
MILLTYATLGIGFTATIFTCFRLKDPFHPSVLMSLFFGIPLLFSMQRLSDLQSSEWEFQTYLLLIYAICIFIILPAVLSIKLPNNNAVKWEEISFKMRPLYLYGINLFAIALYLAENKITSGAVLPYLAIHDNVNVHTASVPIVSIFTTALPVVLVIVNYLASLQQRKKLYYLFIILLIALPLSRLARFEVVTSLLPLAAMIFYRTKKKKRFAFWGIITMVLLIFAGSFVGQYRMTYGGKYNYISYSKSIGFTGPKGPFEVNAILYGYFPLSIENVDRFVKKNPNFHDYQYVQYTFRPVMAGILQLDNLLHENYHMYKFVNKMRDPLNGAAIVDTALIEFSMDFGYVFSFVPMLLYALIGYTLYHRGRVGGGHKMLYYLLFAQAFLLFSFQNVFIESRALHASIFLMALLAFAKKYPFEQPINERSRLLVRSEFSKLATSMTFLIIGIVIMIIY